MIFPSVDVPQPKLGLKLTGQDFIPNTVQPTLHKIPPLYFPLSFPKISLQIDQSTAETY